MAAGVEARLRGQAAASDPPRGRGRGARSPRGARGGGRADDRPVREEIPSDASEATNGPTNRGRGGRIGGRGGRGRGRDGEFGERRRQYDRHDASGRGYDPARTTLQDSSGHLDHLAYALNCMTAVDRWSRTVSVVAFCSWSL